MAKLRTYAEAIDDLGGAPWKIIDATERWFVATAPEPSMPIIIGRPSMFRVFKGVPVSTFLIVIAAAALLAFAIVLLA
jgi:hypothetical protein